MEKKKRNNIKYFAYFITFLIIVLSISIGLYTYISENNHMKLLYNDYSRASIIYSLSFYQNFDDLYNNIRLNQRYVKNNKPINQYDLINDFKQKGYIDVLKYININSENSDSIIESFKGISYFIEGFNIKYNISGEKLFTRNSNGVYYEENDGKYVYKVTKKVISRESFNKLFNMYLEKNNMNKRTYFIEKLWQDEKIRNYYSYKSFSFTDFCYEIENNYDNFLNNFPDEVNLISSNILNRFSDYLTSYVYNKETNEFKLDIEYEEIELEYELEKVQDLYNETSKYYTDLYMVNLQSIWKRLEELNLPLIYM